MWVNPKPRCARLTLKYELQKLDAQERERERERIDAIDILKLYKLCRDFIIRCTTQEGTFALQ
jgi:hypothetical protein